jgi:predicted permease
MIENLIYSILFLLIGVFSISGVIFDWQWFWNNSRAVKLVNVISKKGAQIFYCVLGVVLVLIGITTLFV